MKAFLITGILSCAAVFAQRGGGAGGTTAGAGAGIGAGGAAPGVGLTPPGGGIAAQTPGGGIAAQTPGPGIGTTTVGGSIAPGTTPTISGLNNGVGQQGTLSPADSGLRNPAQRTVIVPPNGSLPPGRIFNPNNPNNPTIQPSLTPDQSRSFPPGMTNFPPGLTNFPPGFTNFPGPTNGFPPGNPFFTNNFPDDPRFRTNAFPGAGVPPNARPIRGFTNAFPRGLTNLLQGEIPPGTVVVPPSSLTNRLIR